jgi:hypothetical protein
MADASDAQEMTCIQRTVINRGRSQPRQEHEAAGNARVR